MPIFDQGYQHWNGTLSGYTWRWLTITKQGVRSQLKSNRFLRFVLMAAWFPALLLVVALMIWGLFEQGSELIRPIMEVIPILKQYQFNPEQYRVEVWRECYHRFLNVELYFAMLLVLLVGPNLISQDLRFNALPLYLSRPLHRRDYFLGKLGVIATFIGAVMILPAVFAYVMGLAFSLDLGVIRDTFGLLLGAVGFGIVVMLSTGLLMLALSSLSRSSRYVAMFWLGIWIVGASVSSTLTEELREPWCRLPSFIKNLDIVGDKLLGVEEDLFERASAGMSPRQPDAPPHQMQPGGPANPAMGQPPSPQRPNRRNSFDYQTPVPPTPWTWSAAVLVSLMGISACILALRVRSLDRLK